jgi:lysylphosphatidylglycerol synthetase-like protein (DUF2156 family)
MSERSVARRPVAVTVIAVLVVISGILGVIGGLILVLAQDNADVLRETGESSNFLLTAGIVGIIVGLIYLAVARGLLRGSNGARGVVAVVSIINGAFGVWAAFFKEGQLQTQGFVNLVLALLVLVALYSPRANAFFSGRR